MIDLTPNRTPKGESCGTCRFAGTHTVAEHRNDQVIVRCRRFPPVDRGNPGERHALGKRLADSHWPHTLWDDWCGEWEARDPDPDQQPAPLGFG